MQHGFIRVAAATTDIRVADCPHNVRAAMAAMEKAAADGVHVLCLQRLGLTGTSCGDLFLQSTLLRGAADALQRLLDASVGLPTLVLAGLPVQMGGRIYDCAAVILDGELLGVVPAREPEAPFAPGPDETVDLLLCGQAVPFGAAQLFACENVPGLTVGCVTGASLDGPGLFEAALCAEGATVLCHPAAEPALAGSVRRQTQLAAVRSAQLSCAYVYCGAGAGESTTDFVYSGLRCFCENGRILTAEAAVPGLKAQVFDTELLVHARAERPLPPAQGGFHANLFRLPETQTRLSRFVESNPFFPADEPQPDLRCDEILDIQARGLMKRLVHTGAKTCVLGLSGGLDSTLALLVCVRAMDNLGRDRADIRTVTMPCFGTTQRTKDNAAELARLLGVSFETIPIAAAVRQHFQDIGLPEGDHSAAFENAQARERTQVLMDLANRCGGLVVGTGDLSELALGWATYNGDHMSMYAVNASIPKTLVRILVEHCARMQGGETAAVLRDVLDTPVSPELLPPTEGEIAQKTEDLVGPYELHDFFLYHMLKNGFSPAKLHRLAVAAFDGRYSEDTVTHWLTVFCRRFFAQQFKRSCAPDGPAATDVSLSPRAGLRLPSDAAWDLWRAELETL